jgi:hypothetical protein
MAADNTESIKITKPNVLVVEGKEEERLFGELIRLLGLQDIQVMGIGGKTKLRAQLDVLTRTPGFAEVVSLGVARDANDNPAGAFQSVRDALRAANLPVPKSPLVSVGDSPKVTVMIVPEENTPGMLEDLCLKAVENDPAMPCVEEYFRCLQKQGHPLPHNISKAKIQVFLASRKHPDKQLGEAAQAGYWPLEGETFEQVRAFLQQIQ